MKIFVTVGNTHYDTLIKAVDEQVNVQEHQVVLQIANGTYVPKNHEHIRFTQEIDKYFDEAELVITHAGAGSVFHLLELNKKMIVVPNTERIDNHQLDLANYVATEDIGGVCTDLGDIRLKIDEVGAKAFKPYSHEPFIGYDKIDQLLKPAEAISEVAGIPIEPFASISDAVSHVIRDDGTVLAGSAIATNPEKIVSAIKSDSVRATLMKATFRYADGIGVVVTLSRKLKKRIQRIPGCELWEALMEKCGQTKTPVFLVGASAQVLQETQVKLNEQYDVEICGAHDGYFQDQQAVINDIVKAKPKVVTVALGSPKQEYFIANCQEAHPDAFYMGVGGTYDVYTDNVKRAPKFFRKLNLEWFYRLAAQPTRLKRQVNLLNYLFLEFFRKI
ncbi:PssE/Cps14G family polysaccharide biosynthesis glycosyltransferase [Thalassotalea fusca]